MTLDDLEVQTSCNLFSRGTGAIFGMVSRRAFLSATGGHSCSGLCFGFCIFCVFIMSSVLYFPALIRLVQRLHERNDILLDVFLTQCS